MFLKFRIAFTLRKLFEKSLPYNRDFPFIARNELSSQQHASVSQGRICSSNSTGCLTEIEVADQTFYLTQAQYTNTGPTSPSADPMTPGAWQGSHWSANFLSHWYDSTREKSRRMRDLNSGSSALEPDALNTGPTGRCSPGVRETRGGGGEGGGLPALLSGIITVT